MTSRGGWRILALAATAWSLPAAARPVTDKQVARIEYAVVPLAGGDTDIGIGAGALGSVARLDPRRSPYAWRLEGMAFATFMPSEGLASPYQDLFLLLTVVDLFGTRARLELRPSFTRENNQRYYGLGNASRAAPDDDAERDMFRRTHPALVARVRLPLGGSIHALLGTVYSQNYVSYGPRSNLARDLASASARVRGLLNVHRQQGLHLVEAGLLLDTRALLGFRAGRSDYLLGATGFLDAGRVWADLGPASELDGHGLGLKYGAGGGLRLRKGETFVLRADAAWSPDARPLGLYFLAGHMF